MDLPERHSLLFKIVPKKVKVVNFGRTLESRMEKCESLLLQCVPSQRPNNLMLLVTGFQRELAGTAH